MDELIEFMEPQQENHAGHGANETWRQCQRFIDKAIELRDTTEKKQLIDANIEGFNTCMKHGVNGEPAEDWYKYTYGK